MTIVLWKFMASERALPDMEALFRDVGCCVDPIRRGKRFTLLDHPACREPLVWQLL